MSKGLGITTQTTLELLTNLYSYIKTYFTVEEKDRFGLTYKMFPDQTGMFQFAKDLNIDIGIEDAYKELCKKHFFKIANRLVMKEIQEDVGGFITSQWDHNKVFEIINKSI